MTGVRRDTFGEGLTFIRAARKQRLKARLRTKRLGEGGEVDSSPRLDTYTFSRLRYKSFPAAVAAGLSFGGNSLRRALTRTDLTMNPDDIYRRRELEEQSDLCSDDDRAGGASTTPRFDAFDGTIFEPSNGKSPDGRGHFTRFTDLTALERGVYVADGRERARAHVRSHTCLGYNNRQIRQSRQTAGLQGDNYGRFHPPAVKSVKWTAVSDSEVMV